MTQTKQALILLLLMTWDSWETFSETGMWLLATCLGQAKQDGLRNLFFKTGAVQEAEKEEMEIHAFGKKLKISRQEEIY